MNQVIVIGLVISILLGISGFLASGNLIVGVAGLVLSMLYFLIIAKKAIHKYETKINRFRECYHFINNFIVSLSIKNSVSSALESVIETMPNRELVDGENIDLFSVKEKIQHF